MNSQQKIQELEDKLQKLDQEQIKLTQERYNFDMASSGLWTVQAYLKNTTFHLDYMTNNLTFIQHKLEDLIGLASNMDHDLKDREDKIEEDKNEIKEEIRKLKNGDK